MITSYPIGALYLPAEDIYINKAVPGTRTGGRQGMDGWLPPLEAVPSVTKITECGSTITNKYKFTYYNYIEYCNNYNQFTSPHYNRNLLRSTVGDKERCL